MREVTRRMIQAGRKVTVMQITTLYIHAEEKASQDDRPDKRAGAQVFLIKWMQSVCLFLYSKMFAA